MFARTSSGKLLGHGSVLYWLLDHPIPFHLARSFCCGCERDATVYSILLVDGGVSAFGVCPEHAETLAVAGGKARTQRDDHDRPHPLSLGRDELGRWVRP
jgi:hypothetical protein